jgi:hypothetical protein
LNIDDFFKNIESSKLIIYSTHNLWLKLPRYYGSEGGQETNWIQYEHVKHPKLKIVDLIEQNAIHMVVVQMGWCLISLNPIIFNT